MLVMAWSGRTFVVALVCPALPSRKGLSVTGWFVGNSGWSTTHPHLDLSGVHTPEEEVPPRLVPREVHRVRLPEHAKLFVILPPDKQWPRLGNITNNFAVLKHTRGYFQKPLSVNSPKHQEGRSPLVDGGNLPSFTLGHDGDDLMRVTC